MASQSVTVLTINGRRQTVKIGPNTTILEVLEQVCQKHNFPAAEYDLKHHNKVLDLSSMFRFSGLPNNALLEMVPAARKRTEADVTLMVQLEDGTRLSGTFSPSLNLLEVLRTVCPEKAVPEANPVIIYMRKEVLWERMADTTLRSLGLTGGRAAVRLLQRTREELGQQANVSAPLPVKERPQTPEKQTKPTKETPRVASSPTDDVPNKKEKIEKTKPSSDQSVEMECEPSASSAKEKSSESVPPAQSENIPTVETIATKSNLPVEEAKEAEEEAIIDILGERDAVLFHLDSASTGSIGRMATELPDSFYEVTVADVRKMYTELRNKVKELEERPLMTAELRQLENSKRMLNNLSRYKNTVIRVLFPDRYVLQGLFKLHETVGDVMSFVRSYLASEEREFYIYTTPPKQILSPASTLLEAHCVPQALLHFGTETKPDSEDSQILKATYYSRLSNAVGALKVTTRSKTVASSSVDDGQSEDNSSMVVEVSSSPPPLPSLTEEEIGSTSAGGASRIPNSNFRASSVAQPSEGKLPKWFKPVAR